MRLFAGDCYLRKACAILCQIPAENLQFHPTHPRLVNVVELSMMHYRLPR